ncbi:hypothetical protein ACULNC_26445 [Shigella flexneri]
MLANTCMWTYRSDECGYTAGQRRRVRQTNNGYPEENATSVCAVSCEHSGNFGGFLSINKLSQQIHDTDRISDSGCRRRAPAESCGFVVRTPEESRYFPSEYLR